MRFNLVKLFVVCCALSGILFHCECVFAEIVPDIPIDPNSPPMSALGGESTASLDYPNAAFLIYEAGGDTSIEDAMNNIGVPTNNVRYRNNETPITQADWQWCDIFILASNSGTSANLAGLNIDDVGSNIVSRVVLSGHDADLHAGQNQYATVTFLTQAINYVMAGSGKGMVALGDSNMGFDWVPNSWGIISNANLTGEEITDFTDDGLATGIYDNLTEDDMSDWGTSFHVYFNAYGLGFKSYEIGDFNGTERVVTIGCSLNPSGLIFEKDDGLDDNTECTVPDNQVTYTVCYDNTTDETFYGAFIIDDLPDEMDYPDGEDQYVFDGNSIQLVEGDSGYSGREQGHYYLWEIGTIAPNDANCVTLDVVVNDKAEPGMLIHNTAELWATVYDPNGQNPEERLIAVTTEETRVCCWGDPNFIYVDQTATGYNTGVSWKNAYTDLADALTRASNTYCTNNVTIYVAQGTYDPNNTPDKSFVLPDNCWLYGGFPSGGCDFGLRKPKRYETILTGLIDDDDFPDADTVVTMGQDSLLDGFTVTQSTNYGIYGSGVDFMLENCRVEDHDRYGIFSLNGNIEIKWCFAQKCGYDGIYHDGDNFELVIENSQIRKNGWRGINSGGSVSII